MRSSTSRTARCLPSRATTPAPATSRRCARRRRSAASTRTSGSTTSRWSTAEKIGIETTTYVRNIFKYYTSYKLTQEARARAAQVKQQVAPAKN